MHHEDQYLAYIRVSTTKQGEKGVSLQEQKAAIERYAEQNGLHVAEWFEEKETAAKRGRPVFGKMIKRLKRGKVGGVIIHKIDRSARNLKDWADLGALIDHGIEVHFANESLDLTSRGGRLSADIQAVVAADYIRNLREEARKGFYGRLKQGLYPLPAPIGYLDRGGGEPKELDPKRAPLVKRLFELYATNNYSLTALCDEAQRLGLRNRNGGMVSRNGLSTLLNNPFYIGIIRIKKTGETFRGIHEPLISTSLFNRVQRILKDKTNKRVVVHDFLFRRLFSCVHCEYSMVGERQKGHVYYRCHTKGCPTTGVREKTLEEVVEHNLRALQFSPDEKRIIASEIRKRGEEWEKEHEATLSAHRLTLGQLDVKLNRLMDAYLDGVIGKDLFEQRKEGFLLEQKEIQEHITALEDDHGLLLKSLQNFLELAGDAQLTYEMANADEKRELLEIVTSNRHVDRKKVEVKLSLPFRIVAARSKSVNGGPQRDTPRTCREVVADVITYLRQHPDQTFVFGGEEG